MTSGQRVMVTGAAGFIGFHLTRRLLELGRRVTGVDSLSDYYDVRLKRDRLAQLEASPSFEFVHLDLADRAETAALFASEAPRRVVHLAAQAGVRYSIENPHAYVDANLAAFVNVLEGCRRAAAEHLVFASSSSVYGANTELPFSVHDNVDHPLSLYAATKKANELMAHAYSSLYGLPVTGLRFFTVYGPWGRPDMAMFRFAEAILASRPIDVYNDGRMQRDFTYVDDVIEGVVRVMDNPPAPDRSWRSDAPDPATSFAPYRLYNVGNNAPVELLKVIDVLERKLGRAAEKRLLPMQAGDVPATYADVADLASDMGFVPDTPIDVGIGRFIDWYLTYRSTRDDPIYTR